MEFASYGASDDPRMGNVPWKVFPTYLTKDASQEEQHKFHSVASNQFGEHKFEEVCLRFKQHVTIDIRDTWMWEYQSRSPFRPCFYHMVMPTCDAYPQAEQWIVLMADLDATFTYQDWSLKILKEQSGGKINLVGSASPCADPIFRPIENRNDIKKQLGFSEYTILGTVMRNQRRKLFPQLFRDFRRFLNETKRNDILLYCHTSYPDAGWDIPKLLLEHGLSTKILFTYVCQNCKQSFPAFFNDALMVCSNCHSRMCHLINVQEGVEDEILCRIYNMFDWYIQYSNSEGFGLPMVESTACGTPVLAVDYSAMSDVVRKLGGFPIKVERLDIEIETGCYRATPNSDHFISLLKHLTTLSSSYYNDLRLKTRENYEKNYNWDTTAQKWADQIDQIDLDHYEKAWRQPPRILQPSDQIPQGVSNRQFARWLITDVLREPERLGTYIEARLIRDLNYGFVTQVAGGMYFNELSAMSNKPNYREFNRQQAYDHMVSLCNRRNYWENERMKSLQK